jgi:hypothetical protein
MPRSTPIKAANKSLPDRSPSQASPKPGPFPPRSAAAVRFLPVAPNGGIPPRSAGIGLTVPCNGNRPADEPFRMHSAPCGWNPMSRGASYASLRMRRSSLDDGPVVYRRDGKRGGHPPAKLKSSPMLGARSVALLCWSPSEALRTIKKPAEWPGRGLRPAATPGEEMQPGSSQLMPSFALGSVSARVKSP